ncbi:hypothetical protein QMZ05_01055 [Bradyrhizobium sp. INPA03-11B]|uniref:hypothetical protein n=1 Tax=Bradyrhizobium sp. INPA03-11B TaxID=418598 RepID=UPI00338DF3FD
MLLPDIGPRFTCTVCGKRGLDHSFNVSPKMSAGKYLVHLLSLADRGRSANRSRTKSARIWCGFWCGGRAEGDEKPVRY